MNISGINIIPKYLRDIYLSDYYQYLFMSYDSLFATSSTDINIAPLLLHPLRLFIDNNEDFNLSENLDGILRQKNMNPDVLEKIKMIERKYCGYFVCENLDQRELWINIKKHYTNNLAEKIKYYLRMNDIESLKATIELLKKTDDIYVIKETYRDIFNYFSSDSFLLLDENIRKNICVSYLSVFFRFSVIDSPSLSCMNHFRRFLQKNNCANIYDLYIAEAMMNIFQDTSFDMEEKSYGIFDFITFHDETLNRVTNCLKSAMEGNYDFLHSCFLFLLERLESYSPSSPESWNYFCMALEKIKPYVERAVKDNNVNLAELYMLVLKKIVIFHQSFISSAYGEMYCCDKNTFWKKFTLFSAEYSSEVCYTKTLLVYGKSMLSYYDNETTKKFFIKDVFNSLYHIKFSPLFYAYFFIDAWLEGNIELSCYYLKSMDIKEIYKISPQLAKTIFFKVVTYYWQYVDSADDTSPYIEFYKTYYWKMIDFISCISFTERGKYLDQISLVSLLLQKSYDQLSLNTLNVLKVYEKEINDDDFVLPSIKRSNLKVEKLVSFYENRFFMKNINKLSFLKNNFWENLDRVHEMIELFEYIRMYMSDYDMQIFLNYCCKIFDLIADRYKNYADNFEAFCVFDFMINYFKKAYNVGSDFYILLYDHILKITLYVIMF